MVLESVWVVKIAFCVSRVTMASMPYRSLSSLNIVWMLAFAVSSNRPGNCVASWRPVMLYPWSWRINDIIGGFA